MTRYWFEHWNDGKMVEVKMVLASTIQEAVSQLSDELKGVFLLKDKQTEQERVRENWQRFYQVSGD